MARYFRVDLRDGITPLVGFEVNGFEIPPALLSPNLHLAGSNLHEHTPCRAWILPNVQLEVRGTRSDDLGFTFQLPSGSQT